MGIVFFGHHVAGLSGNEAFLIFILGFLLVMVEILIFPGLIIPGRARGPPDAGQPDLGDDGCLADGSTFEFSWDLLTTPLFNLTTGFTICRRPGDPRGPIPAQVDVLGSIGSGGLEHDGSASGIEAGRIRRKAVPPPGTMVTAVTDLFPQRTDRVRRASFRRPAGRWRVAGIDRSHSQI